MDIPKILRELGIDFRRAGESPHVTVGWVGIVCPWCGGGTGKYGLGIHGSGATRCRLFRVGAPIASSVGNRVTYVEPAHKFAQGDALGKRPSHTVGYGLGNGSRPVSLTIVFGCPTVLASIGHILFVRGPPKVRESIVQAIAVVVAGFWLSFGWRADERQQHQTMDVPRATYPSVAFDYDLPPAGAVDSATETKPANGRPPKGPDRAVCSYPMTRVSGNTSVNN